MSYISKTHSIPFRHPSEIMDAWVQVTENILAIQMNAWASFFDPAGHIRKAHADFFEAASGISVSNPMQKSVAKREPSA
jgi:hypothetical protein